MPINIIAPLFACALFAFFNTALANSSTNIAENDSCVKIESATLDSKNPSLKIGNCDYKNFELCAQIKTSDSGRGKIGFHTDSAMKKGYAVAIDNSTAPTAWWRATGSLLGVRNIVKRFAQDGRNFSVKLRVTGAAIDVWVDGVHTVEYIEPQKPFRLPENAQMRLSSGAIAITRDAGNIEISHLTLRALPERNDIENQQANAIDETLDAPIRLHQADFPVLDFHTHLKGGFTGDWAFAKSRKIGINYAVAPNCGKDFPLNTAQKAHDYLVNDAPTLPFIVCMQAEGREWYKIVPAEVRRGFAYAFTDAMTFDDLQGRRTHIWRDNEVNCPSGSEEKYMDLILSTICNVLENEPADIYANPMRLPKVLAKDAQKYWTPERRERVLNSLVKGGKALEINMPARMPDVEFIKTAKARGVKFTFGSNNKDSDFGRFEYALEIVEKCGLKASDIWNPYTAKISK